MHKFLDIYLCLWCCECGNVTSLFYMCVCLYIYIKLCKILIHCVKENESAQHADGMKLENWCFVVVGVVELLCCVMLCYVLFLWRSAIFCSIDAVCFMFRFWLQLASTPLILFFFFFFFSFAHGRLPHLLWFQIRLFSTRVWNATHLATWIFP